MKVTAIFKPLMGLLLAGWLAAAPLAATYSKPAGFAPAVVVQQDDDDAEGVTFDNLLPASSYTLYIETRNIGALLRSAEFRETFEPITPMLEQFGGVQEFMPARLVVANADRLQHSRVMIALSPTDSSLPNQMIAFELESEDAAQEFVATLQESLEMSPKGGARLTGGAHVIDITNAGPVIIRRARKLVTLTPAPISFKALRHTNDKLMSDDMNFRAARDHFYGEPLFIYYDIALAERHQQEAKNRLKQEEEKVEAASAKVTQNTILAQSVIAGPATPLAVAPVDKSPAAAPSSFTVASSTATPPPPPAARHSRPVTQAVPSQNVDHLASSADQDLLGSLFNLLLSGEGQKPSPEAVAIAAALENDALAVRALLVNGPGAAVGPVPFLSLPVSGPAISSEAASYLPSTTDIFVAASLDWPRFCELAAQQSRISRGALYGRAAPSQAGDFDARRAAFEKANKVRLADLLAATLGNEFALGVPARYLSSTPLGRVPLKAGAATAEPLLLIAVRDREALAPKLRPLLEALGVKFTNAKATTEKAGDVEITSYGNLAYAFINNYLILTSSAAGIRRVIEARTNNATLAASNDFQSYMQWQPRAVIAQVYVSAAALKGLFRDMPQTGALNDEAVKAYLARYRFDPEPLTYAASVEGVGAHYEVRIPRRLLMRVFSEMGAGEVASRIPRNEAITRSILQSLKVQEDAYKTGHGRYAALDELDDGRMAKGMFERIGYKLELSATDSSYEATAIPVEYGKTGRLSFYTDQSGVVREGDHQGKPASSADKPADPNRDY